MRHEQPARDIIAKSEWSISSLARELGVKRTHLDGTLHGDTTPSPVVREQLPKLLGVPLEQLYTRALLARRWTGTRPGRAKAEPPAVTS